MMHRLQVIVFVVVAAVAAAVPLAWHFMAKPAEGPAGIPLFPGASGGAPGEVPTFPGAFTTSTYYARASVDQVWNWYKSEMSQQGWSLLLEIRVPEIGWIEPPVGITSFSIPGPVKILTYAKGDTGVAIDLENRDGVTEIRLTYGDRGAVEKGLSVLEETYAPPCLGLGSGLRGGKLLIWHAGGDVITEAFKNNDWANLEVRVNGDPADADGALLNGGSLNDSDYAPNDLLEVTLPAGLKGRIEVEVIYKPTNKTLLEFEEMVTPPPVQVALGLDNYYAGSSGLLLIHYGGETVTNAFEAGRWGGMEVRINGAVVIGATLVLNGSILVGDADFAVGDVLKLDGGYTLALGDVISVIYKPTNQTLIEIRVTS